MNSKEIKSVCITGCLGFIGSHFTERCLKEGWNVLGIDKCTYAADQSMIGVFNKNKNFTFREKDIAEVEYLPDCDYIINFAAESHVQNSINNSDNFIKSNIVGTKNLLDLVRTKPSNSTYKPKFFQISTDEVYGDIVEGSHKETDTLSPSNPYSASKAAADMLVLAWSRTYDMDYLILRPTNNYGIRQYPEKLIPLSINNLKKGRKIKLHDEGEPTRNWLHVEDTVDAIFTIIKSNKKNEIYNVSGGFEQSNKDTVAKIIKQFNGSGEWKKYVDTSWIRKGQDVRYSLSDKKLRSLGWSPARNFDEEIEKIVDFYKNNFRW